MEYRKLRYITEHEAGDNEEENFNDAFKFEPTHDYLINSNGDIDEFEIENLIPIECAHHYYNEHYGKDFLQKNGDTIDIIIWEESGKKLGKFRVEVYNEPTFNSEILE